jgi:hypothetical protein
MTQEYKELLLKDLSARLPYGVKVWYKYKTWKSEKFATSIRLADEKISLSSKFNKEGDWFPIEEAGEILIKPYLRPMSSMTEEEKSYYEDRWFEGYHALHGDDMVSEPEIPSYIDWLLENHFDYRDLIPKGLAIEVTEDNSPYKD